MGKKFFWADQIADEVIKRNPRKKVYVCASGITPSGVIHIGNFREVITTDMVVKALKDKGKKVRFIYSWDDFDRFRKVPANIPEGFAEHIGKPLSDVPSPYGKGSYADYFEKKFEDGCKKVGVKPVFIKQSEMNKKCKYADLIKIALTQKDKIKKILDKYRKEPLDDDWLPIGVYCEKCMKDFTKILSYENYEITYECDCGHIDTIDYRKKGIVKLVWRVDWPSRWKYEDVDFEPGGIDHSTPGGSFTTAKEISKSVYFYPVPLYQFYEWVRIKGGTEFSSSAGNAISLAEVLEVYEPEVLRFLFVATRPNKGFQISFDNDVIKLYEDFDMLEEKYYSKKASEQEKRYYELSVLKVGKKKPVRESFRHLITLVQSGAGGKSVRAEKVRNWLRKYAEEDMKFELQEEIGVKLNKKERKVLKELRDVLKKVSSEKKLLNEFYELCKRNGYAVPEFFKLAYRVIIGKDRGPRLAGLILDVGKDKVIKLLGKVK